MKGHFLKAMTGTVYSGYLHSSRGRPLFILDNLRSAFNVGSVFRSADAASPFAVFLTGICCRPGNRKLARTSRGTHRIVPWRYFLHAPDAVSWAIDSGREIVAVENVSGAQPLWQADFPLSSAFILGNEAMGIDPDLRKMAHRSVYLPQTGERTCINVSSMGAVIAAEILRRRLLDSL